jgi:hypothetical protein
VRSASGVKAAAAPALGAGVAAGTQSPLAPGAISATGGRSTDTSVAIASGSGSVDSVVWTMPESTTYRLAAARMSSGVTAS